MTLVLTTKSSNGGPLTGDQVDANWTAIAAAINAVAVPTIGVTPSPDGNSGILLVNGTPSGTLPLPPAPLNDRGAWVTGATYAVRDMFDDGVSTYRTMVAHTSTTIAADLAAGRIRYLAKGGPTGFNDRGTYSATTAYAAFDAVRLTDSNSIWVMSVAGTAAGTAPSFTGGPWVLAGLAVPLDDSHVVDTTSGAGATVATMFQSAIASLTAVQASVTAVKNQLHSDGVTGF